MKVDWSVRKGITVKFRYKEYQGIGENPQKRKKRKIWDFLLTSTNCWNAVTLGSGIAEFNCTS